MLARVEELIFRHRHATVAIFLVMTVVLGWFAAKTHVDASFNKQLPSDHEYIQNFKKYQEQFGGANRVLIALRAKQGDMFTPEFFKTLKAAHDEVHYLPGVDRSQVTSIYSPTVRYIEVVEGGLVGSNVIPADFVPNAAGLERVRQNIVKSGRVGMLVSNDFAAAAIVVNLLEIDPTTGKRVVYAEVADALETKIREKFQSDQIDIHIIGFAKVIGDITDGARGVLMFFGVAIVLTAFLFYYFSQSWQLTILPLFTSFCAVIWQLGVLNLLGFGIDPLSILVPFLVFAIALSHATQMLRSFRYEYNVGGTEMHAARASFSNLFIPGTIAIITDTVGFLTIWLVKVPIIQELAITASIGVSLIILTDRFMLPVLLSYTKMTPDFRRRVNFRRFALQPYWRKLVNFTCSPKSSLAIIGVGCVLWVYGLYMAGKVHIGDIHAGVPELRQESRYNRDTAIITKEFSIGVDVITVIVETQPNGVIDHEVMTLVDRFAWHMRNIEGVQSTMAITDLAKNINAGWNEGSLKWRVIARNQDSLAQSVSPIETSSGLLNEHGSVIPVMVYLKDHKAETINRVIAAVKDFRAQHQNDKVKFQLATGNVGVMAATNETVVAAQSPMVWWLNLAIIALCLISFRSWRATVCVVVPLLIVAELAYAIMVYLEIGLKTSTLPVIALGVGIGVDYGIYLCSALMERLEKGDSLQDAICFAYATMGTSVVFTGLALSVGVGTWAMSALKFQADMGVLLAFMFLVNMLGAMLVMPALAYWLFPKQRGKLHAEVRPPAGLTEATK
jgi:predicted RND superfamily exporter protein